MRGVEHSGRDTLRRRVGVVTQTVEDLQRRGETPVVLYETPVHPRVVLVRGIADELLERRVAERIRSAARRQKRVDVRERVELDQRLRARVVYRLRVEAELVGVIAPDVGHVVEDLKNPLGEPEPRSGVALNRTAEIGYAVDADAWSGARLRAGHPRLGALRILHAELVQYARAPHRHQLPCGGVLTVAEVGPLLHRIRHA